MGGVPLRDCSPEERRIGNSPCLTKLSYSCETWAIEIK